MFFPCKGSQGTGETIQCTQVSCFYKMQRMAQKMPIFCDFSLQSGASRKLLTPTRSSLQGRVSEGRGPVCPRDAWDLPQVPGPGVSESLCLVAQGMLETQQGRLTGERPRPSPGLSRRLPTTLPLIMGLRTWPLGKPHWTDSPACDAWKWTWDPWG